MIDSLPQLRVSDESRPGGLYIVTAPPGVFPKPPPGFSEYKCSLKASLWRREANGEPSWTVGLSLALERAPRLAPPPRCEERSIHSAPSCASENGGEEPVS